MLLNVKRIYIGGDGASQPVFDAVKAGKSLDRISRMAQSIQHIFKYIKQSNKFYNCLGDYIDRYNKELLLRKKDLEKAKRDKNYTFLGMFLLYTK